MDTAYKHFSHAHNLVIHQAHEAEKMSCSGCNSLVMGTIYVCWQCKFVLHEQCFRATRSLKHPSHPSHPLTLVPYPTYPSNSFYCNSCKHTGNGLSYSCSDCEFDLHIHCAQSVSYVYAPNSVPNPITNIQYSSLASNMPEGILSASDIEHIKRNQERLEIATEEYRIAALRRKYILDSI
ncbi:unnamed protein product [Lactuca virosa]|uniref:Phorbol-ester/DAG-type domain-containing protein n=1 Tax=Lactuca virosa TaxID=75947 RepID=A0AAU9LNU1_9ASTR|nr:unnamed protein product [Lactuca virosa]